LGKGTVYVGDADHLYALDAKTGVVRWSTSIAPAPTPCSGFCGTWVTTPVIRGDRVYVGSNNGLYAINAATGAVIWQQFTGCCVHSGVIVATPATADLVLSDGSSLSVVYTVGPDGHLYALNARTGSVIW